MVQRSSLMLALLSTALSLSVQAAEPTKQQLDFFEKEVRPLLVEKCHKCHGETKQSGGLRLDHPAAILAGGETGPAVVPGDLKKSLLIDAINYQTLEMPPNGKLAAREIATLTRWVEMGAPWPAGGPQGLAVAPRSGKITDEDRRWWAFVPVRDPQIPVTAFRGGNEIDQFIASQREKNELKIGFAPEADRATLIRRLSFDLIGLPPTPAEVDEFLKDNSDAAYEQLVDRLLKSPRYGERWARHWLDLVRYADSDGYRIDDYRPNAWRYRDYVIRSFNEDKPYDRFVREQLAGDELFPGNPDATIATGFLRHWIYEYNNRDARGQWQVILDDITDTTADVFLGLGLQCARCHDHKFDPLLQKDYFRLQAFFAAISPQDQLAAATAADQAAYAEALKHWETKTADVRRRIAELEAKPRVDAERDAIEKFPPDLQTILRKPIHEREPLERQLGDLAYRQVIYEWDRIDRRLKGDDKEKMVALRKDLATFDNLRPADLPMALGVTDLGPEAAPVKIPKKGKEPIEPGFPTVLDERPATIEPIAGNSNTTGRRAALARWLTRPENPLTARVIVNRVWQQHFGRGLAANASDFGRLGEAPTHPELLDWLAARFVDDGWSIKSLHRRIVLSATFRQAASHPQADIGRLKDPENRLYWRGNVRRLDAEQIRDSLYFVSNELTANDAGGPGAAGETPRRSIYLRVMRNSRNAVLEAFDAPFWISSASSRHTTTTPVQSLLLINSQFMLKRAEALARRVEQDLPSADDATRIRQAYRFAFGREARDDEVTAARAFLSRDASRVDIEDAASDEAAFLYDRIPFRDGQAAVVSSQQSPLMVPVASAVKEKFPDADFTIEAFFVLRSIYDTGAVRAIVSKWAGTLKEPGWLFGVTGKGSRRKPQTLVLQVVGQDKTGTLIEEPLFSDHHMQLNKPYFVAAAFQLATAEKPGRVNFYVKDLSNDDEPLLTAELPHRIVGGVTNDQTLVIGGRGDKNPNGKAESRFDGLIDDVRLSDVALNVGQLLFTGEGANKHTRGYWRFEAKPDVFADLSGHGLNLQPKGKASGGKQDAHRHAWIDFCHVLLNSNEFLYAR